MKKFAITLVSIICILIICSCSSKRNLEKTVWYNSSLIENNGEEGILVTSLYFYSGDTVDIYSSVLVDSTVIVKPFKYAEGTYSISNETSDETKFVINAKSIDNKPLSYEGAYHKDKAMYLITQDSLIKIYGRAKNIKLP